MKTCISGHALSMAEVWKFGYVVEEDSKNLCGLGIKCGSKLVSFKKNVMVHVFG